MPMDALDVFQCGAGWRSDCDPRLGFLLLIIKKFGVLHCLFNSFPFFMFPRPMDITANVGLRNYRSLSGFMPFLIKPFSNCRLNSGVCLLGYPLYVVPHHCSEFYFVTRFFGKFINKWNPHFCETTGRLLRDNTEKKSFFILG